MFKKIAVATILLASSQVTLANISGTPYIGASVGVNHQLFQEKVDSYKANFGGTGGIINIFGGYGARVNKNIYLGGEIFANTTTGVVTASEVMDDAASLKLRTKYSYGASLIPGLMLSENTMLYGRLGVVKTKFNEKAQIPGVPSLSENNTVTGGQFGLGLQTKVTQKMDLRGEYIYTDYNSFHSLDSKVNASSGQANIGIVYNIA
jgi:outer membrane immunogenic protein